MAEMSESQSASTDGGGEREAVCYSRGIRERTANGAPVLAALGGRLVCSG